MPDLTIDLLNRVYKICKKTLRCCIFGVALFLLFSSLLVASLRWLDPPSSAFILAYNFQHKQNAEQRWLKLDDISPWLQLSVIAAEDQKFPSHHGFDFESIDKALQEDRRRMRGASTITQQLAKNLFLWKGRNFVRKGLEGWYTILIEAFWPKRRILEVYLNEVEFGPGVYGAGVAADRFFQRPAKSLSRAQSALLAAVLPNPKSMSAAHPSAYVKKRAESITKMGRQLGGKSFLSQL